METLAKSIATVIMWTGLLGLIFFALPTIQGLTVVLALVLMIPLLAIMAFMWVVNSPAATNSTRNHREESSREKRKRDVLDAVLREMSDEQLAALRERLKEPDFEDRLDYMLGDDGELVQRG